MLDYAMSHPSFRTQLFRFVDVFPATAEDDREVLRHLDEYFDGADVPKLLDLGLDVAERVPFGSAVSASIARRNIIRMAQQFVLGATTDEAVAGASRLWAQGIATTVDVLGEKTTTPAQADRYAARVGELLDGLVRAAPSWPSRPMLDADDLGQLPRVNVSLKPTALSPHVAPLTRVAALSEVEARLGPIMASALAAGAHLHFDMEHADVVDLTHELFRRVCDAEPDLEVGIVVQAYL